MFKQARINLSFRLPTSLKVCQTKKSLIIYQKAVC